MQIINNSERPIIIAGPCLAENFQLLERVAAFLTKLADELNFDLFFKASFDKANRTAASSVRGNGMEQTLRWFEDVKAKFGCKVLTDVHETTQVRDVAEVCDALQIPAFLCRQTDLIVEAVKTGKFVNVKKGQFLAPEATKHIVDKAASVGGAAPKDRLWLTERGSCFGYGDLVVDMRSFRIMAEQKVPVIFDITHSTQKPAAGGCGVSGGLRAMAPVLARAATATGYLGGYFLEVHPDPRRALSDAEAQLDLDQARMLLTQIIPLWRQMRDSTRIDKAFTSSS